LGWNELAPGNVTFTGTAVNEGYASGVTGDDDWSLFVHPDDPKWMVNSSGVRNRDNWVECEVQPPEHFAGLNGQSEATEERFLQPFLNKQVTVGGTWCEDLSHDDKTELHSLDFVLQDPPITAGIAKRAQFIVTSDGATRSPMRPKLPPHVRSNRVRDFQLAFPPAPPGVSDADWYQWSFVEEVDACRTKSFSVVTNGGQRGLQCHVESGISDENKGFYAATVELGQPAVFVSQSVPASMPVGGRASVTITMRNTSVESWVNVPFFPLSQFTYNLGSQDPQDNTVWGIGRVPIPHAVAPGASVAFTFTITAPTTPGSYPFQWRMVHERIRWFGMYTPAVQIQVTPIQVDCAALGRQFTAAQDQVDQLTAELKGLPTGREGVPERMAIMRKLAPLQAEVKQLRTEMTEGGCSIP